MEMGTILIQGNEMNPVKAAIEISAEPSRNGAESPTAVSFARIANAAIDRGFSIIPLLPKSKTVCGYLAKNGAISRTKNRDLVAVWAEQLPNGNVGVCSDDEITILESDDEPRFRQLVREVSKRLFGVSRELPPTLTSQARPNRPHWFFRNTDRTRAHQDSPGIAGLYEWRHSNQYVVGFGSIHPLGMPYQIVVDIEIVPMPDWLVTVLEEIKAAYRGTSNAASNFVKVGPAGVAIEALKAKYFLDPEKMLADPDFTLEVSAGERHYFLNSIAGLLHDGQRDDDEIFDLLCRFRDQYCFGSTEKGDAEVRRIAEWVVKRGPCVPDIDALLPEYGHWLGLKWFLEEDDFLKEKGRQALEQEKLKEKPKVTDWQGLFHTYEETMNAPRPVFAIQGFLQEDGITLIGGLSGHAKTFMMLSMVKALLTGLPLFGHSGFAVPKLSQRVVYLVPEVALNPFAHRIKLFQLDPFVQCKKFFYRTLSAEGKLPLDDARLVEACNGADVFLDTAVRFMEGDESDVADQKTFAETLFSLQRAGARTITGAHHSPKVFESAKSMALETVLRGSGDIGAMLSTCWGVYQVNREKNKIYVENLKPRDFQPREPFTIEGRPYIDQIGDFGNFADAEEFSTYKAGKRAENKKRRQTERDQVMGLLALGKTQVEIGEALKLSQPTISRLIRGDR
jgi:Bifunctional DNA primase/polymerase, N-terminal/AAA domain